MKVSRSAFTSSGATGYKYGWPSEVSVAIWIRITTSPMMMPKNPNSEARTINGKPSTLIDVLSSFEGMTKDDMAVIATTMTIVLDTK